MKYIFILSLLINFSALGANYGKFKVIVAGDFSSGEEAIFLMNSNGKIKILENDNYMEINAYSFFGDVTLDIRTSGDEDHIRGTVHLVNNKVIQTCSAFIDLKNDYQISYGSDSLKLLRWNKVKKAYEDINDQMAIEEALQDCEENLLED